MNFLDLLKTNKVAARIPTVTFTAGVPTGISFLGQSISLAGLDTADILALDNFVRFQSNGTGGYNLIDNTNAVVNGIVPTYALASVPVSGVTELPAANTFPTGTEVRIHQDCFVGTGHNPMGIKLQADAANNVWLPVNNRQLMFEAFGTDPAVGLVTALTGAGRFNLADDPKIPGGLIVPGRSGVRIIQYIRKIGTSATLATSQIRLGTDLVEANYANNSVAYNLGSISATNNFDINSAGCLITFPTTTSFLSTRNATLGGGGTASTWDLESTLVNTAAAMGVAFTMSILTSPDTAVLNGYQIFLE